MTAAWHGFIHAWHTLGILLKWMCITVVGIPFAILTCIVIGLAAIAFAAICLTVLIFILLFILYIFQAIWMLCTRPPTWIREWRISRAERELMRLPVVNTTAPIHQRVVQTVPRGYLHITSPNAPTLPPPESQVPLQAMLQITSPPIIHIGQALSINHAAPAPVQSLSRMIECQVCLEEKFEDQFPSHPPTHYCLHKGTDCCSSCLAQSITSSFESNVWDDIRCPICNWRLTHKDVAEFATPETFSRYVRYYP